MIEIKLKRILSAMLVLIITVSTIVYAEDTTLTVQAAVKTATEKSLEVLKYSNAVKRYQRDYTDSLASSRQMRDMLEIDSRFRKLSMKDSRSPMEESEFQILSEMLGRYMSAADKLGMEISRELTPDTMKYMLNVNKALLESSKEKVYLNVYQSFNSITKAEDAIRVKTAMVENLEKNYKVAAAKYSLGKLSSSSYNTVNLELQKAKIELNTLQTEKKKAIIELNRLLGLPLEYKYGKYINEEIPETITIKTLQEYMDLAYKSNDSYIAAKESFEIAKKEYEMTTGFYVYEDSTGNGEAYIKYNEAKNRYESAEMNLQLQIMNSFNSFKSQLTNLQRSTINRDLQDRNLQAVKSRYNLGLTTELEVSKANISYYESQLDFISANRDAWFAKLNLDLVCGIAENNN